MSDTVTPTDAVWHPFARDNDGNETTALHSCCQQVLTNSAQPASMEMLQEAMEMLQEAAERDPWIGKRVDEWHERLTNSAQPASTQEAELLAGLRRLVVNGYDIDASLYRTDATYKGIVHRIHNGKPR